MGYSLLIGLHTTIKLGERNSHYLQQLVPAINHCNKYRNFEKNNIRTNFLIICISI